MELILNKWFLILPPCIIAIIFVVVMRLLNRRHIRSHLKSHSVLADRDFIGALKVDQQQQALAIAIRNAVATVTGVPSETLHPSDTLKYIKNLGFDFSSFIIELESFASISLDYEAFWKATVSNKDFVEPATLRELTLYFVSNLESFVASSGQKVVN